jgi:hypothetical protein
MQNESDDPSGPGRFPVWGTREPIGVRPADVHRSRNRILHHARVEQEGDGCSEKPKHMAIKVDGNEEQWAETNAFRSAYGICRHAKIVARVVDKEDRATA